MSNAVRQLIEADNLSQMGGKATALGELLRAGFTVPVGFVVPAQPNEIGSLEPEIILQFNKLGAKFVAVRSSATAEDSSQATWAGQLDTYLNVTRKDLLQRVKQCAESAKSPRAQAYAEQNSVPAGKVAVIVQVMLNSQISGIAFSAHPVTGNLNQIVVEAALGLGEAIVSGDITPDMFVLEKQTYKVIEEHIATQDKLIKRLESGETSWQPIKPSYDQPKLDDIQLRELSSIVQQIENLYGFPVDIEWAYAGGKLYILQSRPITTLG
ncbi:MAG: PEP/pyruvate-binding domain-containing protein [Candidatus Saccharimonadales bacterium]